MARFKTYSILMALLFSVLHMSAQKTAIIPKPAEVSLQQGKFVLDKTVSLQYDQHNPDAVRIAHFFNDYMYLLYGYRLKEKPAGRTIQFKIIHQPEAGKEAYQLRVKEKNISITAASPNGLFYGMQTLKQLLPIEAMNGYTEIQEIAINDSPRFSWRGNMLDVGRHFFPVSFLKKYIDILALYKINTFHWHLTEDQGWRIEIRRYPRLTQTGAWRKETVRGRTKQYDGQSYGGYYTQKEIKEVVAYAKDRFITVVPEIEMPGHALAALASYPELGCTGGPYEVGTHWGVYDDVYCAGKEETFTFLENVLMEVMALFPGEYIHIGGDECRKTRWKSCPYDQARMKKEGLKSEEELQSYLIRRIEKFLNARGRKLIGWNEILEGGLSPNATVMSWQGTKGGTHAAKEHHDVIMSPLQSMYFNLYQTKDTANEPLAYPLFLTLKEVYQYEPVPQELKMDEAKYILGVQSNLWTEYIPTGDIAEYMLLPRLQAEAETAWSSKANKDFDDFKRRLESDYERLKKQGVHFCDHRK